MNDNVNESLKSAEAECAEGRTAPRVTLLDITSAIAGVWYVNGNELLEASLTPFTDEQEATTEILTVCLCLMDNGFTVIGKSAPMSAENFDRELGRKLAYEDCVRQLWPLMAFARKDFLHFQSQLNQLAAPLNSDEADDKPLDPLGNRLNRDPADHDD